MSSPILDWSDDSLMAHVGQYRKPSPTATAPEVPKTSGAKAVTDKKAVISKVADWETFDQVKPTITQWVFRNRVVIGGITGIHADGGMGKTTIALEMAASGSVGRDFIDGAKNEVGVFSTILLSAEDDPGDIIAPRLMAAGADLSRIHRATSVRIFKDGEGSDEERQLTLESDLALIRQRIEEHPDIRLVILDPINNFAGSQNTDKDTEIRSILMPMIKLAQELRVAFVILCHHSKQAGRSAANKVLGTVAFMNCCRIGWVLMKSQEDNCRLMLQSKFNLGRFPGIKYDTEEIDVVIDGEVTKQARIKFLGSSEAEAETIIAQAEDMASRIEKPAAKLIRSMMPPTTDCETTVWSEPIEKKAVEQGISKTTLFRTRKSLRIRTDRIDNQWCWRWLREDEKGD